MLEQKLGLDVAYRRGKVVVDGIFTFEINGELAGYGGFDILAPRRDFRAELIELIGQRYKGKHILVGPRFPELVPGSRGEPENESYKYIVRLIDHYGIQIDFTPTPLDNEQKTQKEFEEKNKVN